MLEVKQLSVTSGENGMLLQDITFSLKPGQRLGITGASGSGKTTLIKSIMGILDPGCRITQGNVLLDENNLTSLSAAVRRNLCGTTLGFIPQSPMTAFDPYMKIGRQMTQTFRLRLGLSKARSAELAANTLRCVNLSDAERILNAYPQQLSGGMLQRVAMAIISGLRPHYILADEPTSSLDEENRDHLLTLLREDYLDAGILLISHDVTALRALCPETVVMNNGGFVERQETTHLLAKPEHAWTKQFSAAAEKRQERGEWLWKDLT